MHLRKAGICAFILAQVTLLLAATGLLGAVPGLRPRAAGAETVHHVSLLAASMQPIDYTIEHDNTSYFLTTATESWLGTTSYVGQVSLPDGSTVTGVRCYGTDTDPTHEFVVRMYRYHLGDRTSPKSGAA